MQSGYTTHITPAEWRWVTLAAAILVLLAFTPFVLMTINGVSGWQFMGVLHNHRDGATYLSKMMLGAEGEWLVSFQHTPEPHTGAMLMMIYVILGHVSGLTSVPIVVLFHVARITATLFMYMALYQLAAAIWMRLRTRRIFFILVSIGAGFGWLFTIVTGGNVTSPDLSIPEAFPFFSSLVNVHFPLTLACLALLTSSIITVLRPGANQQPTVQNGGLSVVLLSLALGFLYPQALVPFIGALSLYVLLLSLRQRKITWREVRWLLLVILPVLPLVVYYWTIVSYNPAMAEWNSQNVTSAPSIIALLVGFGVPLIMALPGIYRAIRRFEADGDRFMLIWLVAMLIAIYLPTNIQRRFAVGMMIPIVYFATRSLEDFWFQHVTSRRWRYRLFGALIPIISLSPLLVLYTPILPVLTQNPANSQGLFLEREYVGVFNWLERHTNVDDVVLASPLVSLWVPAWVGSRVVYGHPFETLDAKDKLEQVDAWYDGSTDDCSTLLNEWDVKYVILGPEEARLGETTCTDALTLVARNGDVRVYAP
ncbi:MAG: hypothetical protein K8L99_17835 [Anaerolineae bacterium]|nr:hypothetical protein [Anaerolineae bacterium]